MLFVRNVYTAVCDAYLQVLGNKEGLNVMEQADPLFLLMGLPTIPVMLIMGKMVRWEDYVLRVWRKYSTKLPFVSYIWTEGIIYFLYCICIFSINVF